MTRQEWIDQEKAIVKIRRDIIFFDLAGRHVTVDVTSVPTYTHVGCGFASGDPAVFWDHLIECRKKKLAIQVDWN